MNKKFTGFLIIFSGALILLGFLYFLFGARLGLPNVFSLLEKEPAVEKIQKEPVKSGSNDSAATGEKEIKRIMINPNNTVEAPEENNPSRNRDFTKNDISRMAASFAERLGSYSNQSNFNNIVDLKLFMSEKMKQWADSYVSGQRAKQIPADIYYGITTKAVAQEIKEYDEDEGKASIMVQTRRREAASSTSNVSKVFNQNIIINFVNEKGAWKVDSANWQ